MVFLTLDLILLLLRSQLSNTSYKDLFSAKSKMNEEIRQLWQDIELKDGQIASLEEARKKDEGDNSRCLLFFRLSFAFFRQVF